MPTFFAFTTIHLELRVITTTTDQRTVGEGLVPSFSFTME
jgi:hypothetical protein